MEQNPFAAIENNALGTLALTQAAIAHGVEQFVLVSTDKAVDPLSIMGASKRIAELILLTLDAGSTHMTAVRLCNVIGSQGSVLPLFLDQLAHGGPLTVTHRDACRYFITLDRAIEVLFAALESRSNSTILIPDPVEPVRILDLAQHLLLNHASAAAIEFTGLRPGDKLTERLLSSRERVLSQSTLDNSVLRAIESPGCPASTLHAGLSELGEAIRNRDLERLIRSVRSLVPEYQPSALIDAMLSEPLCAAEVHA
jgi:FlaA1/EpsC-like NDP-sugar epimerase